MSDKRKYQKRRRPTGTRKRALTRQERKREILLHIALVGVGILILVFLGLLWFTRFYKPTATVRKSSGSAVYDIGNPTKKVAEPQLDVQLLTPNMYSRPGTPTKKIKGIVVHYTANPGSTAQNNRDYFESLKDSGDNQVSSNFIVGIDGEIIQCVPTAEMAYASNQRNADTVSIECCHLDESGEFTGATYDSLVELVAFLCGKFNLETDDIIRHYDVTGKICPKYYVDHEDQWLVFKEDVAKYIAENGE